jgi:hypothetical protein
MIEVAPDGTSVDGGWLARKKLPPAGQVSKLIALFGIAAFVLAFTSRTADRQPRRRALRYSPVKRAAKRSSIEV